MGGGGGFRTSVHPIKYYRFFRAASSETDQIFFCHNTLCDFRVILQSSSPRLSSSRTLSLYLARNRACPVNFHSCTTSFIKPHSRGEFPSAYVSIAQPIRTRLFIAKTLGISVTHVLWLISNSVLHLTHMVTLTAMFISSRPINTEQDVKVMSNIAS